MPLAARSGGSEGMSWPALATSVCSAYPPWTRSGASAVKPSSASLSHTPLSCGTRPHHSWMTRTPGPAPSAGVARYPLAVEPLLGNSTVSPMPLPPPRSAPRETQLVVVPRDHVLHVYPNDPA